VIFKEIRLLNVPAQRLSYDSEDARYDIRLFPINDLMYCDIDIDGVAVLRASRVLVDTPLLPYGTLGKTGNFAVLTNDDDVDYMKFGISQNLVYISE
jgi:hypothetical protein